MTMRRLESRVERLEFQQGVNVPALVITCQSFVLSCSKERFPGLPDDPGLTCYGCKSCCKLDHKKSPKEMEETYRQLREDQYQSIANSRKQEGGANEFKG